MGVPEGGQGIVADLVIPERHHMVTEPILGCLAEMKLPVWEKAMGVFSQVSWASVRLKSLMNLACVVNLSRTARLAA